MACSKFEKIEKLQKKLDEMTSDPAVANELINREMGQLDKNMALNIAREEGEAKGRAEGIAEGEAKGKLKGVIETAKKMLDLKLDVKVIAEATGLSIAEIEALK